EWVWCTAPSLRRVTSIAGHGLMADRGGAADEGGGAAGLATPGAACRTSSPGPFAVGCSVSTQWSAAACDNPGAAAAAAAACDNPGAAAAAAAAAATAGGGISSSPPTPSAPRQRPPSLTMLLLGPGEVGLLGSLAALPWGGAVLLAGLCVMVEALQVHGWLDALASLLAALITTASTSQGEGADPATATAGGQLGGAAGAHLAGSSTPATSTAFTLLSPALTTAASTAAAVFTLGWLSAALSVVMTGQAAAVLLARAMMRPAFLSALSLAAAGGSGVGNGALSAVGPASS
ncbi:hypothetical protein Agub_g15218, partial [Astrephomene gubernaculifera]